MAGEQEYLKVALPGSKTFLIHRIWWTNALRDLPTRYWLRMGLVRIVGAALLAVTAVVAHLLFWFVATGTLYVAVTLGPPFTVALWYIAWVIWLAMNLNDQFGDPLSRKYVKMESGYLFVQQKFLARLSSGKRKKLIEFALSRGKKPQPGGKAVYTMNKAAILVFSLYAIRHWGAEFHIVEYSLSMLSVALLAFDGLSLGALDALNVPLPQPADFWDALAIYLTKALIGFGIIASAVTAMNRFLTETEVYVGTQRNLVQYVKRYYVSTGNEYRILLYGPDPDVALDEGLQKVYLEEMETEISYQRQRLERELDA